MPVPGVRILVYSTFYGIPDFTKDSIKNHLAYCLRHGYDYIPEIGKKTISRQFSWAKISLGLHYLVNCSYDAIFWMDADSWFLNQQVHLESFLDRWQEPIQFSGDENDIFNGGHFLLRNCAKSVQWLRECWAICETRDPRFHTTHKDARHLFDQPGILAVLGGANPNDPSTWAEGFNAINGFPGNPYRVHKQFQSEYAPLNESKAAAARTLICERWRPFCLVHPQYAMNSYPWSLVGNDFIVHFVGSSKGYMAQWKNKFIFYPSCTV